MQSTQKSPHGAGLDGDKRLGGRANYTTGDAHNALGHIPPNLPRDEWARLCFAAQDAGLEFDVFAAWSAQAESFDAADCRDTWRSCQNANGNKRATAGTLFYEAKRHGWRPPAMAASNGPAQAAEPQRRAKAGMAAEEVWARAVGVTGHPYATRKNLPDEVLAGLRVLPENDPLTIAGHRMAGALLVPGYDQNGELQTLQCIPADGAKMNLPGCAMAGASFPIGRVDQGKPIYLAEGIGQAAAIWQATGCAALCCFGWGNVRSIAEAMRQKGARVVIVPDVGKEADAERIAIDLRCSVATMPEGEVSNFDACDLAQRDGMDALRKRLDAAQSFAPEPRLKHVDVADVLSKPSPPPRFVWDGFLPRNEVALLGAHGGTGKSTIALMLAACVAVGRPLFGIATEKAKTVFVSLEDGAPIVRHRLARICRLMGFNPLDVAQNLTVVDGTENPELFACTGRDAGSVTGTFGELETLAQGAGLIVADNASDAFGGDEIQRRQVRAFIRSLARIARANDAVVLLLAHVDKGTSRGGKGAGNTEGYSGSTAWNNSVRSRLFMRRDESGALILEHQKSNHAMLRKPLSLAWPENGLPEVCTTSAPAGDDAAQGLLNAEHTRALMRLIAEFSARGEHVTTATTSRTHAAKLLAGEPGYPKRLKPGAVFSMLRAAERDGHLERHVFQGPDRKSRECWRVTAPGREWAGLPAAIPEKGEAEPFAATAATAATSIVTAQGAAGAEVAATAATSRAGGVGEKSAHEVTAKVSAPAGTREHVCPRCDGEGCKWCRQPARARP